MSNRLFRYFGTGVLAATLALASPALAFHGGGGGMHGGMGGGMHGGGMGGMHIGGMGGGMRGGPGFAAAPFSHAAFSPSASHFSFHGRDNFHRFGFRDRDDFRHHFFHRRFHRFAFFGAPFLYADYGYYDGCWRRTWTSYGPQWVNVCGDYGYQ
ncbi:MAG: hypothetical protein JOY90_03020 [Bradyrhizobium sp.]|uniref:hypothetical protein n=1 Tax=Bradyrhizobium sp. TaxID=376 RepID=UPI001DD5B658|nr:hypothetical protein [Bradyrhizobium sp.]MBV9559422.1 hypothetical protein [Bradyrhizobium sp.]